VTLAHLLRAELVLDIMAATKVSAQTRYRLKRLVTAVHAHTDPFRVERDALIRELGTERDLTESELRAGATERPAEVATTNLPAYYARLLPLLATEITVTEWLLTPSLLAEFQLSVNDELALGPLLVEDTPPNPPAP
jgi:hypothetical protein